MSNNEKRASMVAETYRSVKTKDTKSEGKKWGNKMGIYSKFWVKTLTFTNIRRIENLTHFSTEECRGKIGVTMPSCNYSEPSTTLKKCNILKNKTKKQLMDLEDLTIF